MMKKILRIAVLVAAFGVVAAYADDGLRVYIRAGKKTHGPGAHDYPQFLKDWLPLLRARGCTADGSLNFPGKEALEKTDVLIIYAQNAGNLSEDERVRFDAFQARGGGTLVIHSGVCGDSPDWFKERIGGAWQHRHSRWYEGPFNLIYGDVDHPVTKGAGNFRINDEIYWKLHMDKGAQVLCSTDCPKAPDSPQMWALEKGKARTFVSIPGHWYTSFSIPQFRGILMRAIAWTGKLENVDALTLPEEVAAIKAPKDALADPRKKKK